MTFDLNFTCVNSDASATIRVARSNTKVAPEGMIFTVDVEGFDTPGPAIPDGYNPQHHNLYYYWDFGDPGSSFDALTNALPHQANANTMTGTPVAHTYNTPGTYTVSVLVMEPSSGKTASARLSLSGSEAVRDPNMIFLGANTYYMDTTGVGAGAPAGALVYTDISAALNHASVNGKTARLLFKDGQTWNIDTGISLRNDFSNNFQNIMLAGEGTGARPLIRSTVALGSTAMFTINQFFEGNTVDFVITDLDFEGGWDEITETEVTLTGDLFDISDKLPDYIWVNNCRMDRFNSTLNTQQAGLFSTTAVGMSNCSVSSWLNIGAYLNTFAATAVIGCKMARDSDALGGGEKFDHNIHGPIRSQHTGPAVWAKNDFFNNAGWFPNVSGYRTQQPCLRILQSGFKGAFNNISQNTMEGGFQVLALSRQDRNFAINAQDIVVDGNIMIGGFQTANLILGEYGGVTVRNNLGIRPNVPTMRFIFDPVSMYQVVNPANAGNGPSTPQQLTENFAAPIKVYNNTYVMLTEDGNFNGSVTAADLFRADGNFSNTTESNNTLHAPNAGTPLVADAPLNTDSIFIPRMLGYQSAYDLIEHTSGASVATGNSLTVAYPAGRSAADYGPTTVLDPHEVIVGGVTYDSNSGTASFSFGGSSVTVTNTSGTLWPAGEMQLVLYAPSSPPPRQTEFATPTDCIATYAPLSGSAALGDALAGLTSVHDFYGDIRPFYPSRGAFEISPGPGD